MVAVHVVVVVVDDLVGTGVDVCFDGRRACGAIVVVVLEGFVGCHLGGCGVVFGCHGG